MSKNESQIVYHHYIEHLSNIKFLTITCFIVLAIVIMLILLIILVVLLIMLKKYKTEPPQLLDSRNTCEADRHNVQTAIRTSTEDHPPNTSAKVNPAAVFDDDDTDMYTDTQNLPMSVLQSRLNQNHQDSESSTGLCELLLTNPQQGNVIYESPRIFTYAGRVFASTRQKPKLNRAEPGISRSEPKPLTNRRQPLSQNQTLEWDYFESRHYVRPNESESVVETVDNTWV